MRQRRPRALMRFSDAVLPRPFKAVRVLEATSRASVAAEVAPGLGLCEMMRGQQHRRECADDQKASKHDESSPAVARSRRYNRRTMIQSRTGSQQVCDVFINGTFLGSLGTEPDFRLVHRHPTNADAASHWLAIAGTPSEAPRLFDRQTGAQHGQRTHQRRCR